VIWVPVIVAIIAAVATLGAAGIGLIKKDTAAADEVAQIDAVSASLSPDGVQELTVDGQVTGADPSREYFLMVSSGDSSTAQISPIRPDANGHFHGTIRLRASGQSTVQVGQRPSGSNFAPNTVRGPGGDLEAKLIPPDATGQVVGSSSPSESASTTTRVSHGTTTPRTTPTGSEGGSTTTPATTTRGSSTTSTGTP
jgi:hypothetical protein